MDIRKVFVSLSEELMANFNKSSQIQHSGGKGDHREDAFKHFLKDYLPQKYGVGRGEAITSENFISGEIDIVLYDNDKCPIFIKSESHSIFPEESIYGGISMKSSLDQKELREAYQNIVGFKKIFSKNSFTFSPTSGFASGFAPVVPFTAIVAYKANRSLEAIQNQIAELDGELEDVALRPDLVVVVGLGIVGSRTTLRGEFNDFKLPAGGEISQVRKTGKHTLLRFYMQMINELNRIQLKPLDLDTYFKMPRIVGKHRVSNHDRFITRDGAPSQLARAIRLTTIERIIKDSKPVTYRQHFLNYIGKIPEGTEQIGIDLDSVVKEYNPMGKPPIVSFQDFKDAITSGKSFYAYDLNIDGEVYKIDMGSLTDADFEEIEDLTVEELLAL